MTQRNTVVLTLGAALIGASALTHASGNPFVVNELSSGYSLAANEKGKEGSCGEARCGANRKAADDGSAGDKTREGSCGANKAKEGTCGVDKATEGSCGANKMKEGSCGADRTGQGGSGADGGQG
jgi:uncharacterized low-complexity protein